jgi:LacI family transcriptional regulator
LQDVAKLAGVHTATASRALNPATRGLVRGETAARVLDAAKRLGYVVNPIARSLKTSRSSSIGVVIPDLTNALFPPIMRGIADVLEPLGYVALLVNTDNDKEREARLVAALRARQVEGLIVGTALLNDPGLEALAAEGFPVVLINRRTESSILPTVAGDNVAGVNLAVDYLVGLGHRRIAFLAGPQTTWTGQVRLRAYRSALQDHEIAYDEELVAFTDQFIETEGARGTRELLDRGVSFTAMIAGNDLHALGCFDVFKERGIRCPEDVSLTGFNDMPFVDKLSPAVTTIHIPQYEVGREAARMLIDRINAKSDVTAKSVLLPVQLVVRGSAAAPGGADIASNGGAADPGARRATSAVI